jgi:protein AroM
MNEHVHRPRMGVVVIGQSPRPSVAAEIAAQSPGIAVELVGALDGMTRAEIDAIPPTDGSDALFTLLPNGDAVIISKHVVEERAAAKIATFVEKGVAVTMLACTGKFPGLGDAPPGRPVAQDRHRATEPLVILPSNILSAVVEAVLPRGRLGVFSPLPEQTALIANKWERPGIEVVGVTLRPGSGPEAVDSAAAAMAQHAPDLVVMDCMGYRGADKARVRQLVACPVILAIAAAARVAAELIA